MSRKKKIVIGITGASGTIYAIDLLKKLHAHPEVETHVVVSNWAKQNLKLEANLSLEDLYAFCDYHYPINDLGAAIASGSFLVDAMVITPASMKTVAAIAMGYSDNLIARAADVALKEQRKMILVPREPIPAFYNHPETIQDLVNHQSMKIMDALGIANDTGGRWKGAEA